MSAVATNPTNGSGQVNDLLAQFMAAREGGRRFHAKRIGLDVDPEHCWADFLCRVAAGDRAGIEKEYGVTKAAMAETSGVVGGYTVPIDLRLDLMKDVSEESIFRPRAMVVPMTASQVQLPLPDATTAQSAGTAPYFGGILLQFKPEAVTRPETEPAFLQVNLHPWELSGYALASNNWIADNASGLEAVLRRLFARSVAWYEDYYFLRGTGVGQPLGILNGAGSVVVNRQTGGSFTVQDAGKLSDALIPSAWVNAIWTVFPNVWSKMVVLNTTGWQLNQPRGAGNHHYILNGIQGYVTDKVPALGTKGDVMLFDPTRYVIGDRGLEIAFSPDEPTAYLKNQGVWRIVDRVDGRPWFEKTMTAADGATSVAPYAVLN